jgi:uncharacterized MnhB-related membrane protein
MKKYNESVAEFILNKRKKLALDILFKKFLLIAVIAVAFLSSLSLVTISHPDVDPAKIAVTYCILGSILSAFIYYIINEAIDVYKKHKNEEINIAAREMDKLY